MSLVDLGNRALTYIGANRITSLSDGTLEAETLNSMQLQSLKSILGECCWNFACKRDNLNQVDIDLEWGSGNVFQLPSDLIRIFEVSVDDDYTLEGEYLITDASSIGIKYTYLLTDTSKYTASFIDAYVMRLAYDISYALSNSSSKTAELLKLYQGNYLPIAKSHNSKDKSPKEIKSDKWVSAIYGRVV